VLAALSAAVVRAESIGIPLCIVIVNDCGITLAAIMMDGAKFLSFKTATRKAITAASFGTPTDDDDSTKPLRVAAATNGDFLALKGGLPIFIGGQLVGAIGVGSGTGEQDIAVASAGIAAIEGATEAP